MPQYKLIYFNLRGRAEVIRLLFAQARVEYEDHRIQGPDWPELKKTMPTGTLPVLEIDGVKLPQSHAIARYIARELGLAGSTSLEQAQCDAVLETLADIGQDVLPVFREKDEAKKAEMRDGIFTDKVKPKLTHLENMIKANGRDVFVGSTVTVADLAFFARSDFLKVVSDDPLKEFPKLTALKEKVGKEPKIAEWVAKRPETSM